MYIIFSLMMLGRCIALFQISAESLFTSKGELWISPCGLQLDKLLKNTWFGRQIWRAQSHLWPWLFWTISLIPWSIMKKSFGL